jgi:hypothetical protein
MIYGYLLVRISCQLEVANFGDGLLVLKAIRLPSRVQRGLIAGLLVIHIQNE